jgi:small-conductance mechanosensitive channel
VAKKNWTIVVLMLFCGLLFAQKESNEELTISAAQFVDAYKKGGLNNEQLGQLESKSQELLKSLQACEKQAEERISQLAEIREIDALNTKPKEADSQISHELPATVATKEVDKQINQATKSLISCRLNSTQIEKIRFEIIEQQQNLWFKELQQTKPVWQFLNSDSNQQGIHYSELLPIDSVFMIFVVMGLISYITIAKVAGKRAFAYKPVELEQVSLKRCLLYLSQLHMIPLALAVIYLVFISNHYEYIFLIFLSLLVRDACLILSLNTSGEYKCPHITRVYWGFSSVTIVLVAYLWNFIFIQQNINHQNFTENSLLLTPLMLMAMISLTITFWYCRSWVVAKSSQLILGVLLLASLVSVFSLMLMYANLSLYIMILAAGGLLAFWVWKIINITRKVLLIKRIRILQGDEELKNDTFAFPFWISLVTVVVYSLATLVFLSWLAGVSEELFKHASFYFTEGYEVGSIRLVPRDILIGLVVISILVTLLNKVKSGIQNRWLDKSRLRKSSREVFSMLVWYIGITLAVFIGLSIAGFDLSNLAIIAGALSVGIGFGLKNIVSNFVSGLILLFERPVTRGDWVEIDGTVGLIEKVKIRATRIRTFDNAEILVPNSELLSHHVTNWTLSNSIGRITIKVGVAYGSDIQKVRDLLHDIAVNHNQVLQHDPYKFKVLFRGFGDSALNFELRVMIKDIKQFLDVETELNFAIDKAFNEAGINIPFPQRDIHIKDASELPLKVQTDDSGKEQVDDERDSKESQKASADEADVQESSDEKKDKGEVEQMIEEDEKRQAQEDSQE